jgi:hypothetical protein
MLSMTGSDFSFDTLQRNALLRSIDLGIGQTSSCWVAKIVHWLQAYVLALLPETFPCHHYGNGTLRYEIVGE